MDQPRPTVERVPSRRSVPTVVGLIAVLLTGLLAWQGFEDRSITSETPALPPVAIGSPSPGEMASPTTSQGADPSAQPRSLPSPDIGPLERAGDFALAPRPGSALVQCTYSRLRDGRRYFRELEVQPPLVSAYNDAEGALDVRSIAWRVELQSTQSENVFDQDWITVARSRRQVATATGPTINLYPLSIAYRVPRGDATSILRALVIVEWYTRNLELAGRVEQVADSYREANDPLSEVRPEGCRAARLTA